MIDAYEKNFKSGYCLLKL